MVKADYISAISILLGLSKEATKDLNKLGVKTVEEIFTQYKANAMQAVHAAETRQYAPTPGRNKNRNTRG